MLPGYRCSGCSIGVGYHRQIRKVTKNKGVFTSDMALLKLMYLATERICKKWTAPLHIWSISASQIADFAFIFMDWCRFPHVLTQRFTIHLPLHCTDYPKTVFCPPNKIQYKYVPVFRKILLHLIYTCGFFFAQ
jgi:hypothetical protein